jgi:hypothetical protein
MSGVSEDIGMASSEVRKPNYVRRFVWLAVLIAIVFGGYSIGWFYFAGWLRDQAVAQIEAFNGTGRTAECGNTDAKGYPFRIGLFCDSVRFEDPAQKVTLSAGAFRSAAQVYDPFHIVAELDGPAAFSAPGKGDFAFNWDNLRASARLGTDFPEQMDGEIDKLAADQTIAGSVARLIGLDHGEAHMRNNQGDLDLAASFAGAALAPEVVNNAALPPLGGDVDVSIKNGVAWARSGARDLRGQSGTIRNLALSFDQATGLTLTGTFAVGDDCLLDADLKIVFRNPKGIAEQLSKIAPNSGPIQSVLSGMADGANFPLPISDGKGLFGQINIPPLCPQAGS